MKKSTLMVLLASVLITFGACQNKKEAAPTSTTVATNQTTEDGKPLQKKELKAMQGKELAVILGIDIDTVLNYNGFYHFYTVDGKEILHSKMEIEASETIEEFVERSENKDKARHDYTWASYSGAYIDGVKDGSFIESKDKGYALASGTAIIFDAQQNTCIDAAYDAKMGFTCYVSKGKPAQCTFAAAKENATQVPCKE